MERLSLLQQWLNSLFPGQAIHLTPASSDASFRRYFRFSLSNFGLSDFSLSNTSLIAMDAPPPHEDCRPFIAVAKLMAEAGMHVPNILAQDIEQGFLLLSDLGQNTYLDVMNDDNAHALFMDAIDTLIQWQLATKPDVLPAYDEALLRRELQLFPDWYIAKHLNKTVSPSQQETLEAMFTLILQNNLAQPTVFVHRDYMPRNLMVSSPKPGVLDFQDAVMGPISYDVASLFRDAFISWEEDKILDWTIRYWGKAKQAGLPVHADFTEFYRDFEWMGLQRHLKVLGIFARICYRDGKPKYLSDAPRFIHYIRQVTERYSQLAPLARLFDELHKE